MHVFTLIIYFNAHDDKNEKYEVNKSYILAIMLIISFLQPIMKC